MPVLYYQAQRAESEGESGQQLVRYGRDAASQLPKLEWAETRGRSSGRAHLAGNGSHFCSRIEWSSEMSEMRREEGERQEIPKRKHRSS